MQLYSNTCKSPRIIIPAIRIISPNRIFRCAHFHFLYDMTEHNALKKIPILFIIKHDMYREALIYAITREDPGFAIAGQCGNSHQALEVFVTSPAKIIVIDASMRPMCFAELVLQLRMFDNAVRIVAMTNFFDQARSDLLMNQGANGLITRDMSLESIISVLRKIL
jgi:DNA-binding NarL/FixJ family response regulator